MSSKKSIKRRLEAMTAHYFKEYEIALNKYTAENAQHLANSRMGLGAGGVAATVARQAFDQMATKYLNDCSYALIEPGKRIEQFTAPAKQLLEDIKASYEKKREHAAAFGHQGEFIRLFNEAFADADRHLERLTDDVMHGEIGTDVLYRHVPGLQRHWDGWLKDLFIAVLGGLVGALAALAAG